MKEIIGKVNVFFFFNVEFVYWIIDLGLINVYFVFFFVLEIDLNFKKQFRWNLIGFGLVVNLVLVLIVIVLFIIGRFQIK